ALEAKEGEHARLPPGAAANRIASLRRGADDLEKAELARRRGDAGRAASLFQDAVEEVGADELVDVEPLYHHVAAAAAVEPSPAPVAEAAPAPAPAGAPPA